VTTKSHRFATRLFLTAPLQGNIASFRAFVAAVSLRDKSAAIEARVMRTALRPSFGLFWALILSGCQTVHEVKVDAINDRHTIKGVSYILETASVLPPGVESGEVARYVHAALTAHGYYQAPAGVAEQSITVEYGVGPARLAYLYRPRDMLTIDLWGKEPPKGGAVPVEVREKYLRLTARAAASALAAGAAPEIWSVNLTVEDEARSFSPYLPALTTALLDYVGGHSPQEMVVKIKDRAARESTGVLLK
jgi:hypothetical protein